MFFPTSYWDTIFTVNSSHVYNLAILPMTPGSLPQNQHHFLLKCQIHSSLQIWGQVFRDLRQVCWYVHFGINCLAISSWLDMNTCDNIPMPKSFNLHTARNLCDFSTPCFIKHVLARTNSSGHDNSQLCGFYSSKLIGILFQLPVSNTKKLGQCYRMLHHTILI